MDIEEIKAKVRANQIERHFFAIQSKVEEPDHYIKMPAKAYA